MSDSTAGSPVRTPSRRVEFIDLVRGWALIVMIETHVVNATLSSEAMTGDFFQLLKFINGLVAPSFLFASGFAFALTTRRKLRDYLSLNAVFFRQIRRLLFILLIAYLLHLPKFNFGRLLYQTSERDWQVFFQADVLHCIAVSLLIMQLMLLVMRTERRFYLTLAVASVLILLATPAVWGVDFWRWLPVPLAAYMNGLHYSIFPLFPWSVFLFAGSVTGYFYLQSKEATRREPGSPAEAKMMFTTIWWALGFVALSFPLDYLARVVYPVYDYWRYSPSFTLLRLGLVLLIMVTLFWYERRNGVSPASVVTLVGRESLIVYATHLLLIYGNFGTFNFRDKVHHTYGYLEALAATVVLLILMYILAAVWQQVKHGRPKWKYAVELSVLSGFLGVFFFGPGA